MKTQKTSAAAIGLAALVLVVSVAHAEGPTTPFHVSVLGGVQNLNKNDTALPDHFINIPATAALGYDVTRNLGLEGEFSWLIPVKNSVDLGSGGTQDRKTPNILSYQASVLGKLPVSGTPWTPYVAAGAGAVTFLSNTDADRTPQLAKSQTSFAINFGAGTTYDLGSRWALRADYRELAAFPSNDAAGLSSGGNADPIWMERGTLGLTVHF